jgi:phage gp46-like protein
MLSDNLVLTINGVQTPAASVSDDLVRSVLISLFTWRRANADDATEGQKMGWWADAYARTAGDKIGSRLWLLARAKLTNDTLNRAREYAQEALQWMQDDGVVLRADVVTERMGLDALAMSVTLHQNDGSLLAVRFDNLWGALNV